MNASNPETIYFAGSGDWTQAWLITVSGSARTVPMSHRDKLKPHRQALGCVLFDLFCSVYSPHTVIVMPPEAEGDSNTLYRFDFILCFMCYNILKFHFTLKYILR